MSELLDVTFTYSDHTIDDDEDDDGSQNKRANLRRVISHKQERAA